jgi:hypothetical protein
MYGLVTMKYVYTHKTFLFNISSMARELYIKPLQLSCQRPVEPELTFERSG